MLLWLYRVRSGLGSKCAVDGKNPYSFLSRVPYNTSAAWAKYPDLAVKDPRCLHEIDSLSV